MPPPPLTDEEIRQSIERHWSQGRRVLEDTLMLEFGVFCPVPPDLSMACETIPLRYRKEWENCYRYGLAENAMETILHYLAAQSDPEVMPAHIYTVGQLFQLIGEIVDVDHISSKFVEWCPLEQQNSLGNRVTPTLTFDRLAGLIQKLASKRGETMQVAAEWYHQGHQHGQSPSGSEPPSPGPEPLGEARLPESA